MLGIKIPQEASLIKTQNIPVFQALSQPRGI
jgi:hypothetical protein